MISARGYYEELKEYVSVNQKLLKSFDQKTLLVTGAAGLIGSYLIDLLIAAKRELGVCVRVLACDRDAERLNRRFLAD